MIDPMTDPEPRLTSRWSAGLFGLLLALATAICGLFALLPIIGWSRGTAGFELTAIIIIALFTPMAVILAGATWAIFVFVFTGLRGPMVHRGALMALVVVLGILFAIIGITGLVRGEWETVLTAISMGTEGLVVLFVRYALDKRARDR